jgi:4-hydroxy-L-threonine phosphate dehydrogenase PdxA
MSRPSHRLCLTPGDPLGIGPEITVKFLHRHLGAYPDHRFDVYGSQLALEEAAHQLGVKLPQSSQIVYHNITGDSPGSISYLAIEKAVEAVANGQGEAVVTGPVSKQHLQDAGILATGQTEMLEMLARRFYPHLKAKAEMIFLYRKFRLLLLTRHIPLSRVSTELMSQNNRQTLETLCNFLKGTLGIPQPSIALLGVNPHAGEIGGVEETLIFGPLMDDFNRKGLAKLEGPFAADAFFRDFNVDQLPYDAVVAAYHDQGLIPFKLIAGYRAVNATIGLPFLRTSVGHGTAFDIAGQGIATEMSLVEAVQTALDVVKHPQQVY